MENFNSPVVADDLESWLESTQYCENCQRLSKNVKNRETVLKKLKSRIIATDKIIKQFHLKKNELTQTQQQLISVTEKLKKAEKASQIFQSKVASFVNRDPSNQAKNEFEKKLAEKESTIRSLHERLRFTESEQKIFKESSQVSFTETERLKDELKRQAKLIQSLETNQKRKTLQLEKSKKEIDANKSSLSEMKKLVKSLEKELSQLKIQKEKYFQILFDKGLLPKKEQQAENKRRSSQLANAEEVPSVEFMSDDEDDDNENDVRKKKEVEMPQLIDVNSIIEEFRAFPQMLSPLPLSDANELDSSLDSAETSVNDLAKLLEQEFLQNSELPNQESDQYPTEVVSSKSVHPQTNSVSSDFTASSTSSLPNSVSISKADPKTNSVTKLATTSQLSSAVGESATIGHLSSDSDNEEEKTKSRVESNPSASVLQINKTSNCLRETKFPTSNKSDEGEEFKTATHFKLSIPVRSVKKSSQLKHNAKLSIFGNLSSESDEEEEEFKASAQLEPSFSASMTENPNAPQLGASSNNSLKSLAKEFQLKSPKLCNSEHSIKRSLSYSPVSEDKVCKVNGHMFKPLSSGNLAESVVLNKPDPGSNDKTDPLKSNAEMPNSSAQNKAAKNNLEPVKHVIAPGKHLTSFNSDMINLFGSEFLSSSSNEDSDEEKTSKHLTPSDAIKSSDSVEKVLPLVSKTMENSSSIGNDSQKPVSIINHNSEKSFEKSDEKSISFPKNLSEVNSSLNSKVAKNISVDKGSSLLFEPNSISSNSGGCKNGSSILPKMLQPKLKNVPETKPCMEDPKNVDQNSLKTDPTTLKEFCSSNASSTDVSLKCIDVKVSPEIVCSKSGFPETERQTESVGIIKDSSEAEKPIELVGIVKDSPEIEKPIEPLGIVKDSPEIEKPIESLGIVKDSPEIEKPIGPVGIVKVSPEIEKPIEPVGIVKDSPETEKPIESVRIVNDSPEIEKPIEPLGIVKYSPEIEKPIESVRIVNDSPEIEKPIEPLGIVKYSPKIEKPIESVRIVNDSPEIEKPEGIVNDSPEIEKPIEPVRIVKDSPEKINAISNLKESDQESAIVDENHSETSANDKCSLPDTLEPLLVKDSKETKEMSLNSLSENLTELKPPCLESTKNYSTDRKIIEITMTEKKDSFEDNPNLASAKEKDQNGESESFLEDQSITKDVKLPILEELTASSSEKNWLSNDADDESQTVCQTNVNAEDSIIKGSPKNVVVDSVDAGLSSTEEVQMESKKITEVLELLENCKNTENVSSHLFPTESQSQPKENPSELRIPSNVKNCCDMEINSSLEMASSEGVSVNNSSLKSAIVEKMQPNLSEPISQTPNKCTYILNDTFQTTSPSVPLQIPGGDKSVDDAIVPKKTEKLISSLENNSLAKKPNVLSDANINKAGHPVPPASGENGSDDPDGLFDAADSLLRLSGHGTVNGSCSSDKENELENISDKLIPSETDPKKVNKADNVPSSADGQHYFSHNSTEDSQHLKIGKNSNHSRNVSERCKDAESLTNGTENIPERLNNGSSLFFENGNMELLKNGSKENCKNLCNFNNLHQDTENSESLKTNIKEVEDRLNSSGNAEILGNGLDNIKRLECFHKLSENIEKSASIKTDSIESRKEREIDGRLTESNIDSEKNCIDDKRLTDFNQLSENYVKSGSLRNDGEEKAKKINDLKNLSENLQNSELLKNNTGEENGKKLCSPDVKVGITDVSKCLRNGMKENSEKIHNSNGLCEDIENPDHLTNNGGTSMNNELPSLGVSFAPDVSSAVQGEKSDDVNVCDNLLTNENGISDGQNNLNAEETQPTNAIKNENGVCNDSLTHSVTEDVSSMEEFSDLDSTNLMTTVNRNFVSNINMTELFGDDDDDDDSNTKSEKMVTVTKPKNFTASLSNDSISRVNNCDSSFGSKNQNSLPLFVNNVSAEKNSLDDMQELSESNGFGVLKPRKKRKSACKMAAAPMRLPKLSRKCVNDNDNSGKVTPAKAVINSPPNFIKFVASSEKLFLPTQSADPVSHDNSPPSMKNVKKAQDPVEPTNLPLLKSAAETNCLQTQQLFARKSKGDNSGDICELVKEFILVTGPVSPLPETPEEKTIYQFPNASPPPSKEQIITSTPTSTRDYFQDIKPLLNIGPQISPIVTPKKLRERKSKKCLLKDFVSDDSANAAEPFPQPLDVDIDSGNRENKSDSLTQSKPTAVEANRTMQVDASQTSADKKCLNTQQRLLRKSRALHRICPPPVTSCSKNSKSDPQKLSKNTKTKVPPNSSTAKVPAPSCNSPTMDISLETIPKPTAEELEEPNKEVRNSAEPEKVSTLVESVDEKKNVQSVRKRKLNMTEASTDNVPNVKKQCKKNNAILSRARASLMKVAEREFQTYWKYPSTPPSQVLQKLLQSNREAELIVEVVSVQAVKLLSSTTDNMLAWYVTRCKSNAPTPYFSDREKQLMRLLCLFKRKKDMDNIFSKFRECLQDALTKQDWDSTSLGKWSLCRMYIAMCRLEGLLSEARVFFYTSFCRLPSDQYMTFSLITACTWPLVLSYERKDGHFSLFHVIEYVVIKSINAKQHNKKYFECLVKHCKWNPGINKHSDIQRSLFSHLHDCIEGGATKDEIFCYVKGVELLSLQEKWLWTVSLFRSRINQLVKKCLQFEPAEDRRPEFNHLLCQVFQMLGNLCMKSKKRHKIFTFVINSLLKPFLSSTKFPSVVHLCCAGIVMKLYPFEPSLVYPILESWFQENLDYEPSSKLMHQWILLKNQLNKEMGVT